MKLIQYICLGLLLLSPLPASAQTAGTDDAPVPLITEAAAEDIALPPEDEEALSDEELFEDADFGDSFSSSHEAFGEDELEPGIDPARVEWGGSPQNPE